MLKEYANLKRNMGKGESACITYCKFNRDVIGSNILQPLTFSIMRLLMGWRGLSLWRFGCSRKRRTCFADGYAATYSSTHTVFTLLSNKAMMN